MKKASRSRVRTYLALLAMLAAGPLIFFSRSAPSVAVRLENEQWVAVKESFAGAAACKQCHPDQVIQQLASNHAQTLRDLSRQSARAPFSNGNVVVDQFTGAEYSMEGTQQQPEMVLRLAGRTARQPLSFEFGSGAHAFGYLIKLDEDNWVDARLNYHQEIKGWDWTSSQDQASKYLVEQPLGRPQVKAEVVRCFSCHTTELRAHGAGSEPVDGGELRLRLDQSVLAVTCESCHGPRARHVRERRQGKVTEVQLLDADSQNRICGRCHGLDNIDPAHPVITRFQPKRLRNSRCFLASRGRLSCTTCHDPHQDVRKDAAFYEEKCQSCHSGRERSVSSKLCPVNRDGGCVNCHMSRDSESMLHVTFTDHFIRILKDKKQREAAASGDQE